jgi:hypothetical protein
MKNIDRITKELTKEGAENVLIHSIHGTPNWLLCRKIDQNDWLMTLCNPAKNVLYNLGTVTSEQHIRLWKQLMALEITNKISQIKLAQELKSQIKYFLQRERTMANYLKKGIQSKCQTGVKTNLPSAEIKKKLKNSNSSPKEKTQI